ncbi:MAG TPA: PIN domain-containing protein [Thermoplasmata archaeon]|nr:PIN domain-containing protein [Thermoplasmata archaeon]
MTDTADLNLVLAAIKPKDALRDRALRHLRSQGRLLIPFSVALELLFIAKRFRFGFVESLGAAEAFFDLENRDVLFTAAETLDSGEVATVFDAVHLADAFHRGAALHTADAGLRRTSFPTVGF